MCFAQWRVKSYCPLGTAAVALRSAETAQNQNFEQRGRNVLLQYTYCIVKCQICIDYKLNQNTWSKSYIDPKCPLTPLGTVHMEMGVLRRWSQEPCNILQGMVRGW